MYLIKVVETSYTILND